ncbi:MAG: hypothetical protein AB7Q27_10455 [Acidimicrobiia bacterium]
MNPTELHALFSDKEQTLLVATERARLTGLTEDDLDELLTAVRRARNKYTKLYRRQSSDLVAANSSRAGTSTSNQRTKRKAEIFEDALARVASALAAAARATSNTLKQERLAAASAAKGTPASAIARSSKSGIAGDQSAHGRGGNKGGAASKARRASNAAAGSRRQAKRDSR